MSLGSSGISQYCSDSGSASWGNGCNVECQHLFHERPSPRGSLGFCSLHEPPALYLFLGKETDSSIRAPADLSVDEQHSDHL